MNQYEPCNSYRESTHLGHSGCFPCAMLFLTPGSRGTSPSLTGTVWPFEAVPLTVSSACGAMLYESDDVVPSNCNVSAFKKSGDDGTVERETLETEARPVLAVSVAIGNASISNQ